MTVLVEGTEEPFGAVSRAVKLDQGWPASPEHQHVLAGPVVLDVYEQQLNDGTDDLLGALVAGTIEAGVLLHGWRQTEIQNFKLALWRSAHRFLTDNVELVDRDPELQQLAKILGADLGPPA